MTTKADYITYKLKRADESLQTAQLLYQNKLYMDAISKIYYAAFYAATALMRNAGLNPKTHLGAKALLHKDFIFAGIIDEEMGKLYDHLLNKRFEVDYEYFPMIDEKEIPVYIKKVEKFIETVRQIIEEDDNKGKMSTGFKIIGISVQTTNKNNQSARDIRELWNQFQTEKVFDLIPNKKSNEILSIYTDYKSDYTDEYNYIIGVMATTLDEIPDGLIGREFEPEKFQKFVSKGAMPQAVVNTWMDIWQKDKELNRKYTYDFEVWGDKSKESENSEVEIFIAIK